MSSLREIAIRDGPDHCDVLKHLNLTLLAPDIVAVILGAVVPLGTAGAVGAGNQGQSRRLVVAEGGHTSSGGYATLRSRMRARLDAGCSGTTNTRRQTLSAVFRNPRKCGGFAFWLWTSVPCPVARFGEKFAKFSLSFSGPVDFPIVKSTGWFSEFVGDQRITCGLGRAVFWRQCLPDGILTGLLSLHRNRIRAPRNVSEYALKRLGV